MAANKLTIQLTADQQAQIQHATGKIITELNIDLAATGNISEKELADVSGGSGRIYLKQEM